MRENRSCSELLSFIMNANSVEELSAIGDEEFHSGNLSDFLNEMLEKYNLTKSSVIERSGIDITYGYQIFNGRKHPKRNRIIQICFGFPLTVEEIQMALCLGKVAPLYPRIKWDAYVLFAASHGYDTAKLSEMLCDNGVEDIL